MSGGPFQSYIVNGRYWRCQILSNKRGISLICGIREENVSACLRSPKLLARATATGLPICGVPQFGDSLGKAFLKARLTRGFRYKGWLGKSSSRGPVTSVLLWGPFRNQNLLQLNPSERFLTDQSLNHHAFHTLRLLDPDRTTLTHTPTLIQEKALPQREQCLQQVRRWYCRSAANCLSIFLLLFYFLFF